MRIAFFSIALYIPICVLINKLPTNKVISSIFIIRIAISICDWVNALILFKVLKLDFKTIFKNPLMKTFVVCFL